jgi:NTP pyrophosphatase (non-canonical NTP hydrolase)
VNTINQIADAVHANARAHGFHPEGQTEREFINEQICTLHGEVSELHDAWRSGKLRAPCDKADKMEALGLPPLTCIEEEYADIIIRALDQCRRLNVDIARAIEIKHRFNVTRPFKHGKLS